MHSQLHYKVVSYLFIGVTATQICFTHTQWDIQLYREGKLLCFGLRQLMVCGVSNGPHSELGCGFRRLMLCKFCTKGQGRPLLSAFLSSTLLTWFPFFCFETRFSFLHSPCWSWQSSCYSLLRAGNKDGITMVQLVQLRIQCYSSPRRSDFFNTDLGPTGNIHRASVADLVVLYVLSVLKEDFLKGIGNGFSWQSTFFPLPHPQLYTEAMFVGKVGNSVRAAWNR